MKRLVVLGVIAVCSFLYACSSDDDQELTTNQNKTQVLGTGGEEDQTPLPPPIVLP